MGVLLSLGTPHSCCLDFYEAKHLRYGRTEAFEASNLGSSPGEPAKIVKGNEFIPKPPDPELGYPCCSGSTPCKHWAFDGLNGVWKNTLTGKTRDA